MTLVELLQSWNARNPEAKADEIERVMCEQGWRAPAVSAEDPDLDWRPHPQRLPPEEIAARARALRDRLPRRTA